MRRMLLMSRSLRMFLTEEYSLQSSGSPSALLASTVSKPSSCEPITILQEQAFCTTRSREHVCTLHCISGLLYL